MHLPEAYEWVDGLDGVIQTTGEMRENLWWEERRTLTGWLVKTEVGGKTWKSKEGDN